MEKKKSTPESKVNQGRDGQVTSGWRLQETERRQICLKQCIEDEEIYLTAFDSCAELPGKRIILLLSRNTFVWLLGRALHQEQMTELSTLYEHAQSCHRGGWDNTELMHTADPSLLGNMYTWNSDSYVGSLETSAMVETVNNLLQPQALNAWRDLTTSDQLRAATMLLHTVEESAFVLADNLLKTDIVRENTDNIKLEVARLSTEGNLEDLKFPENMGHGSTIQLSANTLKQNGRN
ncbi:hypothetical protein P7K49_006413, partial [Saguinus oedipus]